MNWAAVGALSELGLFVLALVSLAKPKVNPVVRTTLAVGILFFLALIIYHKLFRLIRKGQGAAVYKVTWGIKHWIQNFSTFKKLGYTGDDVESVSGFEFSLHPTGKPINLAEEEGIF